MSTEFYAGFWRRLVAAILDQIVLMVARSIVYGLLALIVYAALFLFDARGYILVVFIIFGGVIFVLNIYLTWIYFSMMESSSTQGTLGKMALGIRVCHKDEKRALTFEEASVRYFAKILSRLTLFIGYILCAFSSRKQALHDFIGKSVLTTAR